MPLPCKVRPITTNPRFTVETLLPIRSQRLEHLVAVEWSHQLGKNSGPKFGAQLFQLTPPSLWVTSVSEAQSEHQSQATVIRHMWVLPSTTACSEGTGPAESLHPFCLELD